MMPGSEGTGHIYSMIPPCVSVMSQAELVNMLLIQSLAINQHKLIMLVI